MLQSMRKRALPTSRRTTHNYENPTTDDEKDWQPLPPTRNHTAASSLSSSSNTTSISMTETQQHKNGKRGGGGRFITYKFFGWMVALALVIITTVCCFSFRQSSMPRWGGQNEGLLRADGEERPRSALMWRSIHNETNLRSSQTQTPAVVKDSTNSTTTKYSNHIRWGSIENAVSNNHTSEHWWQEYVDTISVVYPSFPTADWCHNNETASSPHSGLYLVKVPKTASSTAAAVALQMAESVASLQGMAHPCRSFVQHGDSYTKRESPFLLWSIIREPHKRSISSYFFHKISRDHKSYDPNQLIQQLDQEKNFQINYLGNRKEGAVVLYNQNASAIYQPLRKKDAHAAKVYNIFRDYHFLAITERMDESLVVMKLLFGLSDEAIVVLNSKQAGGFDDGKHKDGLCHTIQPSFTTQEVKTHIAEGNAYRTTNLDYFLYSVANRSLDKTIDALGKDRVHNEVLRHKQLQQLAEEACATTTIFPCDTNEAPPNPASQYSCYFGDVGCGHRCVMGTVQSVS